MGTLKPIRIAVIGVGAFGRLQALACQQHDSLQLVAVMDLDRDRACSVGAELEVPAYHQLSQLLQEERFAAAIVATPEQARLDVAQACAQAGTHLLLEKPLAPTLEACQTIAAAVRRARIVCLVDFSLRFDLRYLALKEAIDAGRLGDVVSIVARRNGTVGGARIYGRWTDLLMSTAIHELDLMRWYAGPVQRVQAEAVFKIEAHPGVADAVFATLRFENGAIGLLETSWARPTGVPDRLDARCEVVGTLGQGTVDLASHGLRLTEGERTTFPDLSYWPVVSGRVGGTLRAAIDHFVRCIRGEESPRATAEDGLEAVRLALAIKEAAVRGSAVTIPQGEGRTPPHGA